MTAKLDWPGRSLRDQVSEEEWRVRVDLAACFRLVGQNGWNDSIYNHITARVPGTGHILINAFGLAFAELTASSLIKLDLDGNLLFAAPDCPYVVNHPVIHGAVHRARDDVHCVIHTHPRAGVAVSAMKCGLLPISQSSLGFDNAIGYHDLEGPALDHAEGPRMVRALAGHDALILRSHGLVTCGRSVAEAFRLMHHLEFACQIQVELMTSGAELVYPSDAAREAFIMRRGGATLDAPYTRDLDWEALLRSLDRGDPSYKS